MLAKGRSKPYITEALCLSENTVRIYTKRIYAKTGVHSKQELQDLLPLQGKGCLAGRRAACAPEEQSNAACSPYSRGALGLVERERCRDELSHVDCAPGVAASVGRVGPGDAAEADERLAHRATLR